MLTPSHQPTSADLKLSGPAAPRLAPTLERESAPAVAAQGRADPQLVHSIALTKKFARKTAHDFNNILAVIHGFAGILQNRLAQDEANLGIAQQIEASAMEALNLTAWLSTFANNRPRELVLLDLNSVIEEWMAGVWEERPPGVDLEVELSSEPLLMLGDELQLESLCRELWMNSIEAMPNGGGVFWQTSLERVEPGSGPVAEPPGPVALVRLRARDTGEGMNRETQGSIFEPFFSTRHGKGRGLGLTTVYDTVLDHQGFIQVSSTPGAGACVDIYLPAHLPQTGGSPGPQSPEAAGRPATLKVLVVDDEEMILAMVGEMLQLQECEVVTAGSGEAALDIYRQSPGEIGAVVLDMTLPGISGLDTFRRLREINQGVKVILSTGDPHQQAVHDAVALGAFGVLAKPFLPQHLSDVVSRALPLRQAQGGL